VRSLVTVQEGVSLTAAMRDGAPAAPWPPLQGAERTAWVPFSAMVVAHTPVARGALVAGLADFGADPIHEAASAGEALICARTWGPCDLVVVDLDLADGLALSLITDLRGCGWERIMVQASTTEPALAEAAFRLGAQGYLINAAQGALGRLHRTVIDSENRLRDSFVGPAQVQNAEGSNRALSGREVQVLQLVAHGETNREIGVRLGLSALTVKSHLARISRKLGTGDRAQMVSLMMRTGVLE